MAAIDVNTVRRVARLARLELSDQEELQFTQQLGAILDHVNKLDQVDTTGLEPTFHSLPLSNVMRADAPQPSLPRPDLLANAPWAEQGMFRVPRIL